MCKHLLEKFKEDTQTNVQSWSKQHVDVYGELKGLKPHDVRQSAKGSLILLSKNGFLEGIWTHTANLLSLLVLTKIMDEQIGYINGGQGNYKYNDGSSDM